MTLTSKNAASRSDKTSQAAKPRGDGQSRREWGVPMLAALVGLVGLLNLWSAVIAHGPGRDLLLREIVHVPMAVLHGSRTLTALFGLALLMLARSLARHKRQAWRLTVPLIAVSSILHMVKGLDYEEAIISLILLAALIVHRNSFYAENDRPSARQGVLAALGLFTFAIIYGPAAVWLLRRAYTPHVTLTRAVLESTHVLVDVPDDPVLTARRHSTLRHRVVWFEDSLSLICWFAVGYGLVMLLRPVLPRAGAQERDRQRMLALLREHGGPPLAYFGLLPDKQYLFDPASPPAWGIAYRVIGRDAVALGDPIGDPARAADAIAAFTSMCRERDWSSCFYQVTDRYAREFRAARLRLFKVGEDAVVNVPAFTLRGKAFQDLRTAINKMTKSGIVFEELPTSGPADEPTLRQLEEITADWLAAHRGCEKNFAMGAFAPDSPLFEDSRLFLARDSATSLVLGYVSFVPIFGKGVGDRISGVGAEEDGSREAVAAIRDPENASDHASSLHDTRPPTPDTLLHGWALDLMRRRSTAPNGIVDYLIASALLLFQNEGAQVLSLGLSPLAGSGESEPPEVPEIFDRARSLMFERFNRFYNFKGLNAFKAKFVPQWQPRYLVYTSTRTLISSAIAVLRAHNER